MIKSELGLVNRPGNVTSCMTFLFCLLGKSSTAGHLHTESVLMLFCISNGLFNAVCILVSSQSAVSQLFVKHSVLEAC